MTYILYIYIYMLCCEVFKEPNDIYMCRNQCDEFWSNFAHSLYAYCSVLRCCGLMKVRPAFCSHSGPPLPPQPPEEPPSFIRQHIPTAHLVQLARTVQRKHVLFMSRKELREAWISISAYETSRNCWPESCQWRTVTHILRKKSYTKIGDIHKNWCLHIQ